MSYISACFDIGTGAAGQALAMPIQALLRDAHFSPEEISILTEAFEDALRDLKLADYNDPAVTLVAKRIIALGREGERSPSALRDAVLKSFREDPGVSGL